MNETEQDVENTPQDSEVDPEVVMAKSRAYQRERRRTHKKTVLITWALALPVAWLAWETQIYQIPMGWFDLTASQADRLRPLAEVATALFAWQVATLVLSPLRWYLNSRWQVDPRRYGLSSRGGSSD